VRGEFNVLAKLIIDKGGKVFENDKVRRPADVRPVPMTRWVAVLAVAELSGPGLCRAVCQGCATVCAG
jgi:hypothetical protein